MIKVLHTADIHLDTPIGIADTAKAQVLRSELRGAFSSLCTFAKLEKFDIVLIAGDLFEHEFATTDSAEFVRREFASAPDCRFVISPGNHDPYTETSIWAKTEFSDNVYIFRESDTRCFHFDDIGTDVYGYAFTSDRMERCPIAEHPPELSPDRINILCAHADMSGAWPDKCLLTESELLRAGFDYAALGHIHNSDGIRRVSRTWYGYSGCLAGRDFEETGYKGAVCVTIGKNGGELSVSVKGKRFSHKRFATEYIDLGGISSDDEALSIIYARVSEKQYREDTALLLVLEGTVSPYVTLSEQKISDALSERLFYLCIEDRTTVPVKESALSLDRTIRGALYSELKPTLGSENEEEKRLAARALRLGLSALRGEDIL